jgi:hypothetical protein
MADLVNASEIVEPNEYQLPEQAFNAGSFDTFIKAFSQKIPSVNCILGKIADYNATNGTLTVYVGGSTTATGPIKMLNNFAPVIGGAVWLLHIGSDYLAIGQQRFDTTSFLDTWTPYFDSWLPWTPTLTGFTEGTGATTHHEYIQIGKTVICRYNLLAGTSPTATGTFQISLPLPSSSNNFRGAQGGVLLYNTATYFIGTAMQNTDTTVTLYGNNTSTSTYTYLSGVTSTVPASGWYVTGSRITFTYVYETS